MNIHWLIVMHVYMQCSRNEDFVRWTGWRVRFQCRPGARTVWIQLRRRHREGKSILSAQCNNNELEFLLLNETDEMSIVSIKALSARMSAFSLSKTGFVFVFHSFVQCTFVYMIQKNGCFIATLLEWCYNAEIFILIFNTAEFKQFYVRTFQIEHRSDMTHSGIAQTYLSPTRSSTWVK